MTNSLPSICTFGANAAQPSVRPIGDQCPNAELSLIGAMLWASTADISTVATLVTPNDFADVFLTDVFNAIESNAFNGQTGPVAILDSLKRDALLVGERGETIKKRVVDATTSGADEFAVKHYAAAVVADSYRRAFRALADGLTGSDGLPEDALLPYLTEHVGRISAHGARLASLRDGAL